MNPAISALMDRAWEDLRTVRHDLEGGFVRAAISRAYYAAFHAARAALLTVGESPKSHGGARNRFGYHFIRTGRVPKAVGEILDVSETLRNRADYEALTIFDEDGAADLIADVETFVRTVEAVLLPPDTPSTA